MTCNTTDATSGVGTVYPYRAPEWDSCCSIFSFLNNDKEIVVCPVVLFSFDHCIVLVFRFTDSDYHFAIVKLFYD